MIIIESKRKKRENILKQHPNAIITDVTSNATDDLVKLSPFYPQEIYPCHLARKLQGVYPVRLRVQNPRQILHEFIKFCRR